MACKKSELVGAINSFATARASGDNALQQMSAQLLQNTIETLEFEPEEVAEETTEAEEDTSN
jgi:hypothetical protein